VTYPLPPQITDSRGPINTGSGDQYNISLIDAKGRTPLRQAMDDLRELAQCFVYPRGFGKARDALDKHRTVFLHAPPGSGRSAAAKLLLRELGSSVKTLHQLLLQDKEQGKPLDFDSIGDGDYIWLDLTDTGGWSWSEIRGELSGLRYAILDHDAYLVAVLPDQATPFGTELFEYRVQIAPPPLHHVLQRHLRVAGFPPSASLDELPFSRQNRPLRDVPEYVRLITEARDRAPGESALPGLFDIAFLALSGRQEEVRESIVKLAGGSQRALLLTVAMLHGAHADVIDYAAMSLLEKVNHPIGDCPLLERPALDERLREITAERDHSGNVRFKVLGYDSAVRSYFWIDMVGLRKAIQCWLEDVLDSSVLDQNDRDNLVRNFAEQCLNHRYKSILTGLVEEYTGQRRTRYRTIAAALILQCGLRAEQCGRFFRRQIYEWSRKESITDELAAVIVTACWDEISVTHPDEALVRLHNVARRKHGCGAHRALVELVSTDRRFLRQMLSRLTDPGRRKWPVDPWLFLEIADPRIITHPGTRNHSLITEETVFSQLGVGWNLVFTDLENEHWGSHAYNWFWYAVHDDEHRHLLLDVLIHGAEHSPEVLARLYVMAREAEFSETIGSLVLEKITAAQGA
jgi:hypothetical protein